MSNLSLKEQLQNLSLTAAEAPASIEKVRPSQKQQQQPKQADKAPKAKPAWLEHAQYGVELLKAYYPLCFGEPKDVKPLKIGIKQDLVKNLGSRDDIVLNDKACMVNSLAYYVNSVAYHKCVTAGAMRIDLDGNSASPVTLEEANYSAECRKTKLQKKQSSHPSSNTNKAKTPETVK